MYNQPKSKKKCGNIIHPESRCGNSKMMLTQINSTNTSFNTYRARNNINSSSTALLLMLCTELRNQLSTVQTSSLFFFFSVSILSEQLTDSRDGGYEVSRQWEWRNPCMKKPLFIMAGYLNPLLVLAGSLKKKTPSQICLQTNPLRIKLCKTTPLTSFCLVRSYFFGYINFYALNNLKHKL